MNCTVVCRVLKAPLILFPHNFFFQMKMCETVSLMYFGDAQRKRTFTKKAFNKRNKGLIKLKCTKYNETDAFLLFFSFLLHFFGLNMHNENGNALQG